MNKFSSPFMAKSPLKEKQSLKLNIKSLKLKQVIKLENF